MKSLLTKIFFRPSPLNFLLFFLIWPAISLSLAVSTLIGPIHWISDWIQRHGFGQGAEDLLVKGLIILFILISFEIACWFIRLGDRATPWYAKWGLLLIALTSGSGALWLLLHPSSFDSVETNISVYNAQFAFGGYPSLDLLKKLKREGYAGVISTLDPEHIPFEKVLLEKEQKMTAEVGLQLIHLPLLPWIGNKQNQASLDAITHIAHNSFKRYYIHCYLGRDRNGLVARSLIKAMPKSKMIALTSPRNLQYTRHVEHGAVIHLGDQIYMSPKLSEDELMGYVISSTIKQVAVITIDLQDNWAQKDEQYFYSYFVPYQTFLLPRYPYDPFKVLEAARQIKTLPRPLLIYVPDTTSYRSQALIQAIRTDLPPLAQLLFTTPLERGRVGILTTNSAIGPRPTPQEFSTSLYPKGIRHCLYLGDSRTPFAALDQQAAQAAGIKWEAHSSDLSNILPLIQTGGPWYIYGPHLSLHSLSLVDSFEKGPIQRLTSQMYLTPIPTDQELSIYFSDGYIKHILILLDENQDLPSWYPTQQESLLSQHLTLEVIRLSRTYDPDQFLKIARQAWSFSEPLAIFVNNSQSFIAQAFMQAFFTDVPPLPPAWFKDSISIQGAPVVQVAPNIVVGLQPTQLIMNQDLFPRGIRRLVAIEEVESPEQRSEELYTSDPAIQCSNDYSQSECVYRTLSKGGPWYVYGPDTPNIQMKLQNRFGPPLPNTPLVYPSLKTSHSLYSLFSFGGNLLYCDHCFSSLLPSLSLTILLAPLLVLYTLFSATFVGSLYTKGVKHSYTRKIFHIAIFTCAALLQIFFNIPAVILFGFIVSIAIAYTLIQNEQLPFYQALARPADSPDQTLAIFFRLVSTALGAWIAYFLFGNLFIIGLLICGWGDAAAEIVGRLGRHPYKIPSLIGSGSLKTVEGSSAMFVVSFFASFLVLYMLGYPVYNVIVISLATAFIGILVEAMSNSRIDNLTIQVFTTATAYFLIKWMEIGLG